MNQNKYVTSEAVLEGHPDKVCDYIADSILDAHLTGDPQSRVACEVMAKGRDIILAGEISSGCPVQYESVVRDVLAEIGYTQPVRVTNLLTPQAAALAENSQHQVAGDQGIMFGYATDETPEFLPLPAALANRLAHTFTAMRKGGDDGGVYCPDGKVQVTIDYTGSRPRVHTVIASLQHYAHCGIGYVRGITRQTILKVLADAGYPADDQTKILCNPERGLFIVGGFEADCGVTGRKIVCDSYGAGIPVGGGAFSGKSPDKVDRSAAYYCRYVAKQIVIGQLAKRALVSVAYTIGQAEPLAVDIETFGTGTTNIADIVADNYDFTPENIIKELDLRRPIYKSTTNYGHFGRPGLPWE